MKKAIIKPFVWGFMVGAVVLLVVVFATGWVVTSNSAKANAEEMAENAVVDRLAQIAIAQFMQEPNKEEQLKELKKRVTYGMNNRYD
jgi:cobalamin biosynthesis protein CbiD